MQPRNNQHAIIVYDGFGNSHMCWDIIDIHTGWPIVKGDHKSPNAFYYQYLKSVGRGSLIDSEDSRSSFDLRCARIMVWDDWPLRSVVYNAALSDLNSKVRGELDLSIDAAQYRQTVKQFKFIEQLTEFARYARLGVLRGTVKTISAGWLSYQYGWKPLLADLYGSIDESFRHVLNRYSTFEGKAHQHDILKRDGYADNGSFMFPFKARYDHFCKIGITVDNTKVLDLDRWSSLNPVSIAWECLPYSFVVDWLIDVGGTMRNFETALLRGRSFKSGYVSEGVRRTGFSSGSDTSRSRYFATGRWSYNSVTFQRTILPSYPFPVLPRVRPRLGTTRLLNAAALLGTLLGK